MTTWGRDGEKAAVEHILTTYKDEAVSIGKSDKIRRYDQYKYLKSNQNVR